MSDVKQVKVDNWGIYFLQRLKHFFNRTDYCDLTLQFQDNAQLKVHRLVLSACTEYFELLERTCEMYEDCLVMPDDLQADVVVPIINFMYTGHLEFKLDLLERLYQTSQVLNMPVLTKLLESHRVPKAAHNNYVYKKYLKPGPGQSVVSSGASSSIAGHKRSYGKAFDKSTSNSKEKKVYQPVSRAEVKGVGTRQGPPSPVDIQLPKKPFREPRPTRYELPEELDTDNIFNDSFCSISYDSKPLMIHPDAVKHYTPKHNRKLGSSSDKILTGTSTVDIVECKRIIKEDSLFSDTIPEHSIADESEMFPPSYPGTLKDSSQLFDQIVEQTESPKVSVEKDGKVASNVDHAKIISEVLKKYPHLVKSNKNIKLKILNTPSVKPKRQRKPVPNSQIEDKSLMKLKLEPEDYTYETDVIDSKQAAKLIAMGAENIKGPWICLICGTPGKALHFTSYYKFRRHLVEVHNEKPLCTICEYCGLKSTKRNNLLHHLYSVHGVKPPPPYNFPKCNKCHYIALTEGLLVKHKLSHSRDPRFNCNGCSTSFSTSYQLLVHIQNTGHKYSAERRTNLQCIYCMKSFLRESNLYAHLKTNHKKDAMSDGIIDDSDEERMIEEKPTMESLKINQVKENSRLNSIKYEPSTSFNSLQAFDDEDKEIDVQYEINQSGDIVISRKPANPKQKILNAGFGQPKQTKPKVAQITQESNSFLEDINTPSPQHLEDEIVVIDNQEYIMRGHEIIPKLKENNESYIISDIMDSESLQAMQPSTSVEYSPIQRTGIGENQTMVIKKSGNINQSIQIVVSNEEEYKALMASNEPIIFDNGDANKTLAVLTAPHNTMAGSNVESENSQNNNMMIIQDEYPMNVNEAVSTENSNIVVVYSHNLKDQNQQYQIITSGGISTQFVQPSSIITQNYETVTTTAPVMSANVISSQGGGQSWQNSMPNIEAQHMSSSEIILPNISSHIETEQVVVSSAQNENDNLIELPEVNLVPVEKQQCENEEASSGQNDMSVDHEEPLIGELILPESENVVVTSMNTDVPNVETTNEIIEENIEAASDSIAEDELVTTNENIEQETVIMEETCTDNIEQQNVTINECENESEAKALSDDQNPDIIQSTDATENKIQDAQDIPTEHEDQNVELIPNSDGDMIANNTEITGHTEVEAEVTESTIEETTELAESQAYDDIVRPDKEHVQPASVKVDENIQKLTSEWSEDEYDVVEDNETVENIAKEVSQHTIASHMPNEEALNTEQPENDIHEPEECIENIQQEVKKKMLTSDEEPIIETDTQPEESQPETPVEANEKLDSHIDPQEKISSLLNDWEENDSQESTSHDESTEIQKHKNGDNENTEGVIENDQPIVNTPVIQNNIPKDSIKNLVSDWDDEEEEK